MLSRAHNSTKTKLNRWLIKLKGLLTETKMLRRFSNVGNWGINFCTTLLNAWVKKTSNYYYISKSTFISIPQILNGHKLMWDKSSVSNHPVQHQRDHSRLYPGCLSERLYNTCHYTRWDIIDNTLPHFLSSVNPSTLCMKTSNLILVLTCTKGDTSRNWLWYNVSIS